MSAESTAIARSGGGFTIAPANMRELLDFADMASRSDLVPKDYKGKPGNVVLAVQMGGELGLSPMQALQNIAVINGRPCLWGDAMLALCLPYLDQFEESDDGETATCVAVRGKVRATQKFSMADARTAGLANKEGPWKTYPRRMRQMRARGFALRDTCADILRGIQSAEEQEDVVRARNAVKAEVTSERTVEDPKLSAPKQERTSEPPPAAAGPTFLKNFPDKNWAGKPLSAAPPEVIGDYIESLENMLKDETRKRFWPNVQKALTEASAVYDARVAAEMDKAAKPDPVAEGLQKVVDERESDQSLNSEGSWLEAPQ